jgi:hypothetical protein
MKTMNLVPVFAYIYMSQSPAAYPIFDAVSMTLGSLSQSRKMQDKQDYDDAIQISITCADSTIQCRYVPQTPASPPTQAVRR